MRKRQITNIILLCVIALTVIPVLTFRRPQRKDHTHDRFRVAVCLDGHRSSEIHFSVGFNYELLKGFAGSEQLEADIFLAEDVTSMLDSLLTDSLDAVVMPAACELSSGDGYMFSKVLEDSTVWVTGGRHRNFMAKMNSYMSHLEANGDYSEIRERFTPSYEPFRRAASGRTFKYASPYDELIKKYAATLGWDWRVLCALIWQESRFHIEASSRKGARGLMQMIPVTAERFGNGDSLDPESSLEAAVNYLARLQRMFSAYASGTELMKFTLAAYNAGEGRILDCISYAKGHGMPYSTWEDLEEVIPLLRESENIDSTVRLGVFRGHETVRYIARTDSLYKAFCKIAPGKVSGSGLSSQGQPSTQTDTVSAKEASQPDRQ